MEKRARKKRQYLEEKNGWKLPNLMEDINIQEAQWTPSKINSKKLIPRHIIIKLSKTTLNAPREKWFIIYKGYSIILSADSFLSEMLEARGRPTYSKMLKDKNLMTKNFTSSIISLKVSEKSRHSQINKNWVCYH